MTRPKPKYKTGDYVIVHPYSDPSGIIAQVMSITHKMDQGHVYIVKYVEGPDSFGRDIINCEVLDGNEYFIPLGDNLEIAKILFGRSKKD